MRKSYRCFLLAVAALVAATIFTHTVSAAGSYTINGISVQSGDFGNSPKDECYAYAQNFYKKVWNGATFSSNRHTTDNYLVNLSKGDLPLTAENLKKYISGAALGSSIRICSSGELEAGDGYQGHSLFLVQKDESGFTTFNGGRSQKASPTGYKEEYMTWEGFASFWGKIYTDAHIKYIKWPNAAPYGTGSDTNPAGGDTTGNETTPDSGGALGTVTDPDAPLKLEPYRAESVAEIEILFGTKEPFLKTTTPPDTMTHRVYQVEITEPGYLNILHYNNIHGYGEHVMKGSCLYASQAYVSSINAYFFKGDPVSTGDYIGRTQASYYLMPGTYYYKIDLHSYVDPEKDCFLAVFLPAKAVAGVDTIEYDEYNTSATVRFHKMPGEIEEIRLAPKENTTLKALKAYDNDSYWSERYTKYADPEAIDKFFKQGWEIKENGTYTLYFRSNEGEGYHYPVMVTVTIDKLEEYVPTTSVTLNKTKATLKTGKKLKLKATVAPKFATNKAVTWSSSNKKVATVSKNGVVTAKKKGKCTITVKTADGKKKSCKITVVKGKIK